MGQPVRGFVAVPQLAAARKLYSHEEATAAAYWAGGFGGSGLGSGRPGALLAQRLARRWLGGAGSAPCRAVLLSYSSMISLVMSMLGEA